MRGLVETAIIDQIQKAEDRDCDANGNKSKHELSFGFSLLRGLIDCVWQFGEASFHRKPEFMPKIRTRIFQSWFRMRRPMTLGVRAIVENEDGKVLLVRHTYTPGLFLPGGGVEKAEPAELSIRRELVEEAGVEVTGQLELLGVFSNHRVFPNDHVLLYRLAVSEWTACDPTSRGEISERVWVDPASPPQDVTPGTGRRLAEHASGARNSDGYW